MFRILAINPGSTSTKIALYEDENEIWNRTLNYTREGLSQFGKTADQMPMRLKDIESILAEQGIKPKDLDAVVGRGGPFKPLKSGTYSVDEKLLRDIGKNRVQADHISNFGAVLAFRLAEPAGIPSFFVDPVSVDEFDDIARISGIPEIPRVSLVHALNVKATARKAAAELKRPLSGINLIVAHLGGGISICPLLKGRIIDVNNANEGGPFSPERAGSLPSSSLVKLCFSGQFTYEELKKRLVGNGGLAAYLGTHDTREVETRIQSGDETARLVYTAMAYQIAKEIGSASTVLKGEVDGICLTGGIARSEIMVEWIRERVGFLAKVMVYPGENELESLALGALRVLRNEEEPLDY